MTRDFHKDFEKSDNSSKSYYRADIDFLPEMM